MIARLRSGQQRTEWGGVRLFSSHVAYAKDFREALAGAGQGPGVERGRLCGVSRGREDEMVH